MTCGTRNPKGRVRAPLFLRCDGRYCAMDHYGARWPYEGRAGLPHGLRKGQGRAMVGHRALCGAEGGASVDGTVGGGARGPSAQGGTNLAPFSVEAVVIAGDADHGFCRVQVWNDWAPIASNDETSSPPGAAGRGAVRGRRPPIENCARGRAFAQTVSKLVGWRPGTVDLRPGAGAKGRMGTQAVGDEMRRLGPKTHGQKRDCG